MERRNFLQLTAVTGLGTLLVPGCINNKKNNVPAFLKDYEETWLNDPRKATLDWFTNARYGLFMHYGLYSLLGRHEWVQFREKISVSEYAKLGHPLPAGILHSSSLCDN